jgi:putative protease
MELEVFVHGALCIAYSGRCLLSGYINKRDANQGACTNACRWQYQAHEAEQTPSGDIIPSQALQSALPEPVLGQGASTGQLYLLQESSRPNDYMPAFEDEHGTYIMNSRDLRAVQHVPALVAMGVRSLKIEGRTKSHYYVARTAQVYRKAIDDAQGGREFDRRLLDELENLANRGYTEGFFRRHVHDEYQNYQRGHSVPSQQQFVGEIVDAGQGMMTVDVKNRFARGDRLELMTPRGNSRFQLEALEDRNGLAVDTAPGSGHRVRIPAPESFDPGFALLLRDLPAAG